MIQLDWMIAECEGIINMLTDDLDWEFETQHPSVPDWVDPHQKTIERFILIRDWLVELKELRHEVDVLRARIAELEEPEEIKESEEE